MSLVEIRPLPRQKWHGKKDKEDFTQPVTIEVLYDKETGKYATGLTTEEAIEYGSKMGVDLGDTFNFNEPHSYWSSKAAWISLPNHPIMLDPRKPAEFVKIKNLKASRQVANSVKEYEEGKWPYASHVIFDENDEVEAKATKAQARMKATVAANELSADAKIALVQVLSNKNLKGRGNNIVDVEIEALIQENPTNFLKYLEMGKDEVTIRAQVLEMLQKHILTQEGNAIFYMGDQIAMDYESAVKWFKDPNNQRMKVSLLEKLMK